MYSDGGSTIDYIKHDLISRLIYRSDLQCLNDSISHIRDKILFTNNDFKAGKISVTDYVKDISLLKGEQKYLLEKQIQLTLISG